MGEHLTYWGELIEDIVNQSRDFAATHPVWESALAVLGSLAGLLLASLSVFFTFRHMARRFQRASPKFRRCIWIAVGVLVAYGSIYFGTTTVRPQGHGGLTGPLRVRVFQGEKHLIVFYPLYLVERWIRNGSLDTAVYYFNVEFKDGRYPHTWLYGDGVYSSFW
jgi:hypothetical protein